MFHFPGCPPMNLLIQSMVTGHCPGRVPPFGYPGIKAYLQLPQAFRSLSRPSSAISAMASTLRSYSLDLLISRSFDLRRSFASSVSIAFLRLLRRDRDLSIRSFLPCAVFKVRRDFAFANPQNDTEVDLSFVRLPPLSLRLFYRSYGAASRPRLPFQE